MGDLATGMLVRHATLGLGRVVLVEPTAVHVFFPGTDSRQAAKLRWPAAKPLLTTEGVERDAWLESLSSFELDPETGRYTLATNFVTHEQAVDDYLARRPVAATPSGRMDRVEAWRAASAEFQAAFPPGEGERLAAARNARELARRLNRVAKATEGIPGALEPAAFADALKDTASLLPWAETLFALLSVPSPARPRFDALFAATAAFGREPAVAWPLATLFPFIASPARHIVLWPRATTAAAERLGFDLRYAAAPSYPTYVSLRALAARLFERLAPHGAQDLADVEALLFATASRRGIAKPGSISAPRPPPPAQPAVPRNVASSPAAAVRSAPAGPSSRSKPRPAAHRPAGKAGGKVRAKSSGGARAKARPASRPRGKPAPKAAKRRRR